MAIKTDRERERLQVMLASSMQNLWKLQQQHVYNQTPSTWSNSQCQMKGYPKQLNTIKKWFWCWLMQVNLQRSLCLRWETHSSLVAFAAVANGRLRRLAVRWKLKDARYCRRWRQSHAHCRCGYATPVCKPNPNLNQRPPQALLLNTIRKQLNRAHCCSIFTDNCFMVDR